MLHISLDNTVITDDISRCWRHAVCQRFGLKHLDSDMVVKAKLIQMDYLYTASMLISKRMLLLCYVERYLVDKIETNERTSIFQSDYVDVTVLTKSKVRKKSNG